MHIEYTNIKTGQLEKQEVQKSFYETTFAYSKNEEKCLARQGSICIGLQLPHKSTQESMDFWEKISPKGHEIAYLCSDSFRIPFYVLDGNLYDKSYNSSVLFAHVGPFLFSDKDRPKRIDSPHELK